MWRPDDWDNPFSPAAMEVRDRNWKPISHHQAFEAGADAMLEGLLKMGEYEHANCDDSCAERRVITIRFIPDEEG